MLLVFVAVWLGTRKISQLNISFESEQSFFRSSLFTNQTQRLITLVLAPHGFKGPPLIRFDQLKKFSHSESEGGFSEYIRKHDD